MTAAVLWGIAAVIAAVSYWYRSEIKKSERRYQEEKKTMAEAQNKIDALPPVQTKFTREETRNALRIIRDGGDPL